MQPQVILLPATEPLAMDSHSFEVRLVPAASAVLAARSGSVGTEATEATLSSGAAMTRTAAEFAERLVQVAGDEQLQVSVRDAALTPQQHEAIAGALLTQIHSSGRTVGRVYINGELFEADVAVGTRVRDAKGDKALRVQSFLDSDLTQQE